MSSDEAPKIEPTLTIDEAPSIVPDTSASPAQSAAQDAPQITIEPQKIEPKIEAKPEPAPQIAAPTAIVPYRKPDQKAETQSRTTRFALLAACVAIAASFGAIGGSLGVAKFAPPMLSAPQTEAITVAREHMAEEIKALKESVAHLRTGTKSLNDSLASLKTSVTASNNAQNTQIGKIAEMLDRVEKSQTEQRKTATATQAAPQTTAPETTGSIAHQKQAATPMVLGAPPTTLKPPVLQGWVLRRVYDGAALVEGREGVIEVEPGAVVPGLGRIEEIRRQDGRWVMMTSRGMVVGR
jgi:hypothetical protein